MIDFPCNACGQCCRLVSKSAQTAHLDRGDGVCRHFDDDTNLCLIYHQRPLECRVKDYYITHLRDEIDWETFVQINLSVCQTLQDDISNHK
ncbi:zinc/iron-chelating domain-containing protein [Moraxella caviae]|uniref:Zinc/iron-chelating domain-containing protein n=1 Tax=Moraxella caviae TaxID=34060 RepID=A0A1T0A555_9GAMM|nr:zinc/iron-chelating domain-containing protein [Moraxella caviae]STZ10679.1 Uncharacterised protein [Moraxella caviae]